MLDPLLSENEAKPSRELLMLIRSFEELRGRSYEGSFDVALATWAVQFTILTDNSARARTLQSCAIRFPNEHNCSFLAWLLVAFGGASNDC